mgnify:CR=1 FL=1
MNKRRTKNSHESALVFCFVPLVSASVCCCWLNLLEEIAGYGLLKFLDAVAKDQVVVQLAALAQVLGHEVEHLALAARLGHLDVAVEHAHLVDQAGMVRDAVRIRLQQHLNLLAHHALVRFPVALHK